VPPATSPQDRAAAIAAELASLGLALPGTLLQRRTRCGRPACACHADPPALHGPYWQWTRKAAGKTITRIVPDDQLADYRQWISNDHRLRALVAELETLTLAIADASRQRKRRTPAPPAKAGKTLHNTVDTPRLTRGPRPQRPAFPQVTAKREDLTKFHQVSAGQRLVAIPCVAVPRLVSDFGSVLGARIGENRQPGRDADILGRLLTRSVAPDYVCGM
jgi:hypothetical protein